MTEALKPYAEYKESGSQWIGSVPSSWTVRKMRTLISSRSERNRPDLPLLSVAREKGVFVRSLTDANENHNFIPDDLTNYKVAHTGDLVINKMKAWQGSMGIAPCDGIVSPAYFVFEFRIVNHAFGQALLRSKPYVAHFGQASDGVRIGQWDLSIPGMRHIPVLVPSEDEQDAIVRFLDHTNRKINRLIRDKRRLIELLNEQKQAIIHRAVTRGLDPNVHLKPSGIDWFGDVPENWEVQKVKQVSKLLVSNVDKISLQNEMSIRLCNYTDVYKNEVISDKINFMVASARKDEINKFKLKIGDVVITKDSEMWNDIGVPALVAYEAPDLICGYHLAILRPDARKMSGEFLLRCFQDRLLVTQLHILANGITRYGLSQQAIKNCLVPVPPVNDQCAICKILKTELLGLNAAKVKALREIDLLREYRTRLISDVVTGKFDVRGVELPEIDEADTIEDVKIDEENEAEELIETEGATDVDE